MKLKREFKIGLISFAILVAFIWGYNFIKGRNLFSPNYHYYAVYPSSGGLQSGRPVKINGVTVGLVSDIKFSQESLGRIIVRFEGKKEYRFTKNSIAEIAAGESLMSDAEMNVILMPGGMLAENGDTLKGLQSGGLSDVIKNTIGPIKHQLVETLATLDTVLTGLNQVLNDKNRANVEKSLADLSATLENASSISENLDIMLRENRENLSAIASNMASGTEKINTILDSLSAQEISQSITNLNLALSDFKDITSRINAGEGSIGKLLADENMYDNLVTASSSLNALLADIKANPKRYVNVTVFGKREKTQKQIVKASIAAQRLREKAR